MQEHRSLLILIKILPCEAALLINGNVNGKAHCFNQIRKRGTQKIKMHKNGPGYILQSFIFFHV